MRIYGSRKLLIPLSVLNSKIRNSARVKPKGFLRVPLEQNFEIISFYQMTIRINLNHRTASLKTKISKFCSNGTLKKPFSFTFAEFRFLELKTDSGIKTLRDPYILICSHEDGFLNLPQREGFLYGVQSSLNNFNEVKYYYITSEYYTLCRQFLMHFKEVIKKSHDNEFI